MQDGTSGRGWRVFLASLAIAAVIVGVVDVINIVTRVHEEPGLPIAASIVWEGSSWVSWLAFLWVAWIAYRLAPPRRPYWRLIFHVPGALLFALGHVGGFVALRWLIYAAAGATYTFSPFWPHFLYEFSKDGIGYVLMIIGFTLNDHIAGLIGERRAPADEDAMFAIRDGARLLRVPMADILAIGSAGNYVEFVLRDGRKPLMRSPLSAVESELVPRGFLRVHRSWLVNPACMTALEPDGSGDYTVALGDLRVPLSRRFPQALAKLRAA